MSIHSPKALPGVSRRTAVAMAGGLLAAPRAQAQKAPWPQQPIKFVIGYPPGGGGDGVGRPLALGLERRLGVPVVLDYRPGAGGAIAAQAVAHAPADGHTLYLADNGAISVTPAYRSVGYRPADFSYVGGIGELPMVLVAHPEVQARDIRELAALSHTRPQGLSYASGGVGSIPHLEAEMLRLQARMKAVHVAYKGSGQASTDLISGVVDFAFFAPTGVAQHVQSGRLRALAVTTPQRLAALPAVPTVAELSFPTLQATYMSGVLAPRGLPAPVFERLSAALAEVLADPEVVRQLEATGLLVGHRAPAAAQEAFEKDLDKWRALIHAAKLKLD
ncbi:Bug family tripartite tricarboxylate transporter substrate binding protein [Pseudorhodoferax sp.]|uniref:Bug family tripartite tricarboxylate transporter substrate binding protein n=1 Tax=Pseudorhodoferax sp. TaxID=1993553 RepID=UPI002DD67D25|nr:tripartite tricarboxylate transporter substrate binding protein [Pseudorhodoferax sp.]